MLKQISALAMLALAAAWKDGEIMTWGGKEWIYQESTGTFTRYTQEMKDAAEAAKTYDSFYKDDQVEFFKSREGVKSFSEAIDFCQGLGFSVAEPVRREEILAFNNAPNGQGFFTDWTRDGVQRLGYNSYNGQHIYYNATHSVHPVLGTHEREVDGKVVSFTKAAHYALCEQRPNLDIKFNNDCSKKLVTEGLFSFTRCRAQRRELAFSDVKTPWAFSTGVENCPNCFNHAEPRAYRDAHYHQIYHSDEDDVDIFLFKYKINRDQVDTYCKAMGLAPAAPLKQVEHQTIVDYLRQSEFWFTDGNYGAPTWISYKRNCPRYINHQHRFVKETNTIGYFRYERDNNNYRTLVQVGGDFPDASLKPEGPWWAESEPKKSRFFEDQPCVSYEVFGEKAELKWAISECDEMKYALCERRGRSNWGWYDPQKMAKYDH